MTTKLNVISGHNRGMACGTRCDTCFWQVHAISSFDTTLSMPNHLTTNEPHIATTRNRTVAVHVTRQTGRGQASSPTGSALGRVVIHTKRRSKPIRGVTDNPVGPSSVAWSLCSSVGAHSDNAVTEEWKNTEVHMQCACASTLQSDAVQETTATTSDAKPHAHCPS